MPEPRVKAKLWVQMALRLGAGAGRSGVVVRSGDPDAGGILVLLRGREGTVVLSQVRSGSGRGGLAARYRAAAGADEAAADAYVARQVGFDPDLWVIEFEAPDYLPPFEGKIV